MAVPADDQTNDVAAAMLATNQSRRCISFPMTSLRVESILDSNFYLAASNLDAYRNSNGQHNRSIGSA